MSAKPFFILSIDGGGLRGIIPVKILQEVEKIMGSPVHKLFNLVAGTSTGGLIACAATLGVNGAPKYNLEDIEKMYVEKGNEIFPRRSYLGRKLHSLQSLFEPDFSSDGIDKVLKSYFSDDDRISSCLTPLFIPAYDLQNNRALFFKSRQAATNTEADAKLYDVCRATSAGPTYLPAYCFKYVDAGAPHDNPDRVCIDGGVYMNNPAVGASVEVSKYKADKIYNRPDLSYDDIRILSLGTGHYAGTITKLESEEWGQIHWAQHISDIMMQAVNQTSCYEADELTAPGNHLRFQVSIDNEEHADMTNSSDENRNYLVRQVYDQVISKPGFADKIKAFFNYPQV